MQSGKQMTVGFISALLVRRSIGYDQSALDESFGPTGKRRAGKLACAVWSGGKAARPYLSLLRNAIVDDLLFHELLLLGLLWLCVIWLWAWPGAAWCYGHTRGKPVQRAQKQAIDHKPFAGLTTRPFCAACAHAVQEHIAKPPPAPPPLITSTRGRRRPVDTQHQFCPEPSCGYYGWTGRGNIGVNGYPSGGPWRQLQCVVCGTYFLETHGTPFHGKRVP